MSPPTTADQGLLALRQLEIGYGKPPRARALAPPMNATLRAGELVCLIGPNGAGKSTLIRTLAGMQGALGGDVELGGDPVSQLDGVALARRLSVVLTERVDVGNLSVHALVALGRHPHTDWTGRLRRADREVVAWALEAAGLQALAHRHLNELSDGERQKVMIARALAQEPRVLVLDEPTAYLDLPRRVEIMHLLHRLVRRGDRAILLSTHDLDLALRTADRLWLLPPGGPLRVGAPEDLVLQGDFGRTFAAEAVVFDLERGSFRIAPDYRGKVRLEGSGLTAFWTRHALERAGYEIVETGAGELPGVALVPGPEHAWLLTTGGRREQFATIADLLAALER